MLLQGKINPQNVLSQLKKLLEEDEKDKDQTMLPVNTDVSDPPKEEVLIRCCNMCYAHMCLAFAILFICQVDEYSEDEVMFLDPPKPKEEVHIRRCNMCHAHMRLAFAASFVMHICASLLHLIRMSGR